MASGEHNRPQSESQTVLDELIRDSLHAQVRHTTGSSKAWAKVLQRAQTEITQLPPSDSASVLPAETALNVEMQPDQSPALVGLYGEREKVMVLDMGGQITYYRRLMEMKMWRTIVLGLASGTI